MNRSAGLSASVIGIGAMLLGVGYLPATAEDAGVYDVLLHNASLNAYESSSFTPNRAVPFRPRETPLAHSPSWRRFRISARRAEQPQPKQREVPPPKPKCDPCAIPSSDEIAFEILHDKTLRPGDVVMLNGSLKVFRGADQLPYDAQDFTEVAYSDLLTKSERRSLAELSGEADRSGERARSSLITTANQ